MNTTNPSTDRRSSAEKPESAAAEQVSQDAKAALDTAKADIAEAGEEVRSVVKKAKREAENVAEQASEDAMSFAEEQRIALCGSIDRVADATRKVASELEAEDAAAARAAKMIAGSIGGLGSTLREHNVDDLVSMAADFGRRQPATFLAAAAVAGFAASRFLKASAARGTASGTRRPKPSTSNTMEGGI